MGAPLRILSLLEEEVDLMMGVVEVGDHCSCGKHGAVRQVQMQTVHMIHFEETRKLIHFELIF